MYRGKSRDPSRDMTDGRLGMGEAVMCVMGASRIRKSSMFTSGLSSCSNKTSSCVEVLLSVPPVVPRRDSDWAEICRRNVASGCVERDCSGR